MPQAIVATPSESDVLPLSRLRRRLGRWWWIIVGMLWLLAVCQFVPWREQAPDMEIDWSAGTHEKFRTHFDFGKAAFTYGPWGILWRNYSPATYLVVVAGWIFIATAVFLGTWEIAKRMKGSLWQPFIWMIAVLGIMGLPSLGMKLGNDEYLNADPRLFGLIALLAAYRFHVREPKPKATTILLTLAVALAGLVKFSLMTLGGAIVFMAAMDDIGRLRRWPGMATIYLFGIVGFWLLAGQHVASLPSFLRLSAEVASKYTEAMSGYTDFEYYARPGFFICGMLLIALVVLSERRGAWVFVPMLAVYGLLFVDYKAGFVRPDQFHVLAAVLALFTYIVIYAGALQPIASRKIPRALLIVSLAAGTGYVTQIFWRSTSTLVPVQVAIGLIESPVRLSTTIDGLAGKAGFVAEYDAKMNDIRRLCPCPGVSGTVDVYPWGEPIIIANGWTYDPRPVPQSYSAYSSHLADIDADHLRGADAPDWILFAVRRIDGRLPALQDAPSWPELLTRYDITSNTPWYLTLHRAPRPRSYQRRPIHSGTYTWHESIPVPSMAQGPIWMTVNIHGTYRKPLQDFLFKPPAVAIDLTSVAGRSARFRVLPAMLGAGFLLSPVCTDRMAFAALESRQWQTKLKDQEIRTCAFVVEMDDQTIYQDKFDVSFSRLEFEHPDVPNLPKFEDAERSTNQGELN